MGTAAASQTGEDELISCTLIPSQAQPLTKEKYVDGGGRTLRVSAAVTLHIYDLGKNEDTQTLNRFLRFFGTGIFHCGVEVYGREWSFRGTRKEGTGTFACKPKCCVNHSFCESVHMGDTAHPESEVLRILRLLEVEWPGRSYSTLRHNCCHFSDKLCQLIGVGTIPSWVKSAAQAAAAVSDEIGGIPAFESRRAHQEQQQSPLKSQQLSPQKQPQPQQLAASASASSLWSPQKQQRQHLGSPVAREASGSLAMLGREASGSLAMLGREPSGTIPLDAGSPVNSPAALRLSGPIGRHSVANVVPDPAGGGGYVPVGRFSRML